MISHQYFNPQKATHPPSGGVGHIVAVFQIVAALAGNQGFAEAAGFQGRQIVLGAVNLVRLIQLFGTGGHIGFQANISVRIQKIIDIVIFPFDCLPVFSGAVTFGKFEVVGGQPLQSLKNPQQNALHLGFHLLGKVRIIHTASRFFFRGQHQLAAVKAIAPVKQRLQIPVGEGQQPGAHPSLIALLALALQIHFALGGDDGFHIVGLAQGFHPHIVIYAQEDMFQVGTGKSVLRYFPDATVLHVGAE